MVFQIFYFFHNSWGIASIFKTVLKSATLKLKNEALNPNSRHHFFGSIYADHNALAYVLMIV